MTAPFSQAPDTIRGHRMAAERIIDYATDQGRDLTEAEDAVVQAHSRRHRELIDAELASRRGSPSKVAGPSLAEVKAELAEVTRRIGTPTPSKYGGRPSRATCFHEAGHAVAFLALGIRVVHAAAGSNGGEALAASYRNPLPLLAGGAAELLTGGLVTGYGLSASDRELLDHALVANGWSEARVPRLHDQAMALVRAHWPAVVAVAAALQAEGHLDGNEVAGIAGAAMRRAARAQRAPSYRTAPVFYPGALAAA